MIDNCGAEAARTIVRTRLRRLVLAAVAWLGALSALHLWLNVDLSLWRNQRLPLERRKLQVGYIPVT